MSVAGLVLAAGEGRRIGGPKALLLLEGERLVDRAVRVLREGGCDPVVVVAGAAALEVHGATVVDNPQWRTGMGSSLQVGLSAVSEVTDADAVVISLVDQPRIGPEVVARLVSCRRPGGLAVAAYSGLLRNPVLVGRSLWSAVGADARGDAGARTFVAEHPELVTAVECADIASPDDLDTLDDLSRLTR